MTVRLLTGSAWNINRIGKAFLQMDKTMHITKLLRIWVLSIVVAHLAGCGVRPDSLSALHEKIQIAAESLRLSQGTQQEVSERFVFPGAFIMIVTKADGFDEPAAARAEVPEYLRQKLLPRFAAWPPGSLMALETPTDTSVMSLPAGVRAREQMVLKGEGGNVDIVVRLAREQNDVWLTTVNCDSCSRR